MSHLKEMLKRLPLLYREGELVEQVLNQPSLHLDILDEDGVEVQRAHWFNTALNLDEAARLAAILNIAPESWQNLDEYRVWVHALRNAMLQNGAVTREAIEAFIQEYATLYQNVASVLAVAPFNVWESEPSTVNPAFLENPPVRQFQRVPNVGGIEPLWQFSVEQKGLDVAYADVLMVGLPSGPESVPVIVNLTTQEALFFMGNVPPGQRLWIDALEDGSVRAHLENQDVSDQMYSVTGVVPGTPWEQTQVQQPARALSLARGHNDLWFLPVAHFDALGLDRFLLALADIVLQQGRFDQTSFDRSVFYQDAAVALNVSWLETQPASFRVELPAGALRNPRGRTATALQSRDELGTSLDLAVNKLRGAGIASSVVLQPFREVQAQTEYLVGVLPITVREVAPVGADQMPDAGGVFGITQFNESKFR